MQQGKSMMEHLNSLDILPIEDNGLTSSLILYSPELCILSSQLLNQFVSLRTPFTRLFLQYVTLTTAFSKFLIPKLVLRTFSSTLPLSSRKESWKQPCPPDFLINTDKSGGIAMSLPSCEDLPFQSNNNLVRIQSNLVPRSKETYVPKFLTSLLLKPTVRVTRREVYWSHGTIWQNTHWYF